MKDRIKALLSQHLHPSLLEIEDNSASHAGHNPAAKEGGTHFTVRVVSENFNGKTRIERHKMIYKILENELKGRLHALAITAHTPQEHSSS